MGGIESYWGNEEKPGSGWNYNSLVGARQHFADPGEGLPLVFGHDQKFESAMQSMAITHNCSDLDHVRRYWNRKLHGDDFPGRQFASQCRPNSVLAEFTGATPQRNGVAIAEGRDLNVHVHTVPRETP